MKYVLILLIIIKFPLFCSAQTSKELYMQGLALKDQKKSREALQKFLDAENISIANSDAIYESAWCYNDLGNYASAIVQLVKIRREYSSYAKYHFEKGYAYYKLGKVDSSNAAFLKCLELKPDYANVAKYQGFNAYLVDNYSKANDFFSQHLLNLKAKNKEETDYLFWYRKGFCGNALKTYNDAITSLQKSLEYKKDYINTYLELGFANTKLKQSTLAINYFKEANKLDSKNHIPYNGIGEVYRDVIKNLDSALYWYNLTLTVKPKERKACYGIGYIYNAKGKYQEAIPFIITAIEQESNYTAAYIELGYAYHKTNKNDEALLNFNKAITLDPKNANARYYKGLVFIQQRNKTLAQQMVDELKLLSSKNAQLLQEKVQKM